jgi:hypothetical protein
VCSYVFVLSGVHPRLSFGGYFENFQAGEPPTSSSCGLIAQPSSSTAAPPVCWGGRAYGGGAASAASELLLAATIWTGLGFRAAPQNTQPSQRTAAPGTQFTTYPCQCHRSSDSRCSLAPWEWLVSGLIPFVSDPNNKLSTSSTSHFFPSFSPAPQLPSLNDTTTHGLHHEFTLRT